jgi:hypothetical protein
MTVAIHNLIGCLFIVLVLYILAAVIVCKYLERNRKILESKQEELRKKYRQSV